MSNSGGILYERTVVYAMSTFVEPPIPACYCGGQRFERVTVKRPGCPDYVTDFMKCSDCWVMFHVPVPRRDPAVVNRELIRELQRVNGQPKPRRGPGSGR